MNDVDYSIMDQTYMRYTLNKLCNIFIASEIIVVVLLVCQLKLFNVNFNLLITNMA